MIFTLPFWAGYVGGVAITTLTIMFFMGAFHKQTPSGPVGGDGYFDEFCSCSGADKCPLGKTTLKCTRKEIEDADHVFKESDNWIP